MFIRLKGYLATKVVDLIKIFFKENFKYYFDLQEKDKNVVIDSKVSDTAKLYDNHILRNVEIGNYTYVSNNSVINNTSIGKFCSIGPNFIAGWGIHPLHSISTSPMFYSTMKQNGYSLTDKNTFSEMRNIVIGNDVFIGMNVTILDGVTVGDGAVIGAGAVVSKDIPPYAIAVGVPIKIIKYRFSDEVINKLLNMKWWDWDDKDLNHIVAHFYNVNEFTECFKSQV